MDGHISRRIALLNKLELFVAASNRLRGRLPAELFFINSLFHLDLARNRLEGPLPDNVGNAVMLRTIILRDNPGITGASCLTK